MLTFNCKWPAKDAGKSCTDNRQCRGICEVPDSAYVSAVRSPARDPQLDNIKVKSTRKKVPTPGTPMRGVCSAERADDKATNCKNYISEGVVAQSECYE